MYKYLTANNTNNYIDKLDKMINKYNNTIHSAIKMKPKDATLKENTVLFIKHFMRIINLYIHIINLILEIR